MKTTGDGAIVEFGSAVDALRAAIEFQQAVAEASRDQIEDTRIMFRVGLHLGDLIVDGDDIYGDGVNIASRLEDKAPPGGIVVSGNIHDVVAGKLKATLHDLGELALKNIERPVRAFRAEWVAADWPAHKIGASSTSGGAMPPREPAPALALPDKPPTVAVHLPPGGSVIDEQTLFYCSCTDAIRQPQSDPRDRSISIASLHGHVGRRTPSEPSTDTALGKALADFVTVIAERIASPSEPWRVRQLVNIVSLERLDQVVARQLALEGEHNEVRAIVEPGALPVFSPLVVANQHVFLALDDDRLFRAKSGVYLNGREAARWALSYFDDLWNRAQWTLRDQVGRRDEDIDELRAALQALEARREQGEDRQRRIAAASTWPSVTPEPPRESLDDDVLTLLSGGESRRVEFKSSLRISLPDGKVMKELESAVVKTVAGFLNSAEGGSLFIGVDDSGRALGLDKDFASSANIRNRDGFERHLLSLLESRLGRAVAAWIQVFFPTIENVVICQVQCRPAAEPVFDRAAEGPVFWLRVGNATKTLQIDEAARYFRIRWP